MTTRDRLCSWIHNRATDQLQTQVGRFFAYIDWSHMSDYEGIGRFEAQIWAENGVKWEHHDELLFALMDETEDMLMEFDIMDRGE